MVSISRWRLRLVPFEVRMWRLKACPRLNLPVPVFLKRFAAPLCVFNLGIAVSLFYNILPDSWPIAWLGPLPLGRRLIPELRARDHKPYRLSQHHRSKPVRIQRQVS